MKQNVSHLKTLFPTKPPLPIKAIKRKGPKIENYKKKPIPSALREAVWIINCGRAFDHKCMVSWCPNIMSAFDFQAGHNIPESHGGPTNIDNLIPICARCNNSMGDRYTIDEWNAILGSQKPLHPLPQVPEKKVEPVVVKKGWYRYVSCFS
jgi:5-methylcytosine-specific restriction endonuclease McrA